MAMLKIDRDNMVSSSKVVRNFSKMLDKSKEKLPSSHIGLATSKLGS